MLRCAAAVWLALVIGGTASGCGGKVPTSWMDARAAAVHCSMAGRQRMPPVMAGIPAPLPPTGLYARGMDPMALNDLGYQRDHVACAMVLVPSREEIDAAAAAVLELVDVHQRAGSAAARAGGGCECEAAFELGVRGLVSVCHDRPTRLDCDPTGSIPNVRAAMEPLNAAIARTRPALVHWRLAGRTDRSGWFADRATELVARHPGGSAVYLRGSPIPSRDNHELIRALLDVEDVVAVVRQDSGRVLLVVREVGSDLVLDHFSHPPIDGPRRGLVAALDNANLEAYVAALEGPENKRGPELEPAKGNLIAVDRALLEDADRLVMAAAPLSGEPYIVDRERWDGPEAFVDRVELQAPFGKDGEVLTVRLELSDLGTAWAQTLTDDMLTPQMKELGLAERGPTYVPPPRSKAEFFLRGSAADDVLFHGLHQLPSLMREVEIEHPNTVRGRVSAWRFELPAAELGPAGKVLPRLREHLASKPYTVETNFDTGRDVMVIELKPR